MITHQELASACVQVLETFEGSSGIRAECVAIMYGPDPESPSVLLFPLPLADVTARQSEPDIVSILNPAEYAEELKLTLPDDVDARLPGGDNLQIMVREAVAQMRRDMPDKLIYMTDPECSELADSVREARIPPSLAWLTSRL